MTTSQTASAPGLVTDMAGLRDSAGTHLGYTAWREMTQQRVNEFADVTEDHNFIHVDPERAKSSPFGGTIAHGYLSLSLLAPVTQQLLQVTDAATSVNYGLDKLRFPAPLPVGAHVARRRRDRRGDRGQGRPAGQGRRVDRGQGRRSSRAGRRVPVPALRMSAATQLEGKAAVVTGSGRGLGRAYAAALAAAGASVVVNDVDEAAAAETVDAIAAQGGTAVAEIAAVGDTASGEALVGRAVSEFGRLDIMVTNAGVLRDKVLWKMSDDDFDLVVRTHLRGTFTCARAAAVRMREQGDGGRLILVGSPAGQFGSFGQTNYAAAKAGIVAFARTWAMELARAGITVNAIVPTAWTQMTASIPVYEPLVERVEAGEDLPREVRRDHAIGMPDDCAPLVVYLASDAAAGITGQAIGIGGDKLTLYSHPAEAAVEFRDGGWSVTEIAERWPDSFAATEQPFGIRLPALDLS